MIAPEAVDHDPAAPALLRALRGPEVLKRTAGMERAAFPDMKISVDDVIAAGDKVVLRWHSEGLIAASSLASRRPAPVRR